jgi:hypothetical protein
MQPRHFQLTALVAGASAAISASVPPRRQDLPRLQASSGLQLLIDQENAAPTLRVVLPGRPASDRAIEILFPEHITAVRHGSTTPEQLYLWQAGLGVSRPTWRRVETSFEYERDLPGSVHLRARSTLDSNGVRFRYEFRNGAAVAYDMIYAVTDPRLTSIFHDLRLERTYVHYATGLQLLAAETPARLTMPLQQWLPLRYLAAFTWPVPPDRIEDRGDGIAYYNTSRAVDQPFIATVSSDRAWVVASVARTTGNVWSNPELTCQHVDPQISLAPGETAVVEVKMLILRGSLNDAYRQALQERASLQSPGRADAMS